MLNPVDTVAKWLADFLILSGGPADSRTIKDSFKKDFPEISGRTLERAKTKIGIKIIRKTGTEHGTLWTLPDNFILCKICNWMARWMTMAEIQASFKPVRFPENNVHINRNPDS